MVHHFDIEDALKYGVNAAVILNNIQFWIKKNEANGEHYHDLKYWTYNSVRAYSLLFPYMTEKQIRTAIDLLIEKGVISRGNYNKEARDRTTWYCLGRCICPTGQLVSNDDLGQMVLPSEANAFAPQGGPLPDSKQHIVNTDSKHSVFTSSETEEDKNGLSEIDMRPFFLKNQEQSKNEEAKPKEKKHPAQKKEKVKGDTLYPALMEVYYMWFKQRSGGIPPNILGQEGKALKSIVEFFKSAVNSKLADGVLIMDIGPDTTEDEIYKDQSVKMFSYILENWNKLSPFLQQQTKLIQINSNLTNIINHFTNGRTDAKRGEIDTRTNTERVSDIHSKIKQQYSQQG